MATIAATTAPAALGASEILGTRLNATVTPRAAPSHSPGSSKVVALFSKKSAAAKQKPAPASSVSDELAKWYGEMANFLCSSCSAVHLPRLPMLVKCLLEWHSEMYSSIWLLIAGGRSWQEDFLAGGALGPIGCSWVSHRRSARRVCLVESNLICVVLEQNKACWYC